MRVKTLINRLLEPAAARILEFWPMARALLCNTQVLSRGGGVSFHNIGCWVRTGLLGILLMGGTAAVLSPTRAGAQGQEEPTRKTTGQEELTRKTKVKVAPAYPELARRMKITGTVKVLVVVSASGNLKDSKVVGGNPLLVNAAMDALKKWKFEPADAESSGTVEFKFQPQN
jgi:TonB family protein